MCFLEELQTEGPDCLRAFQILRSVRVRAHAVLIPAVGACPLASLGSSCRFVGLLPPRFILLMIVGLGGMPRNERLYLGLQKLGLWVGG